MARVWAVSDGEKIERDDLASPLRARNSVWDGRRVRLFGARNEVVAFQVIVEADARGHRRRSRLALPELRRRGGARRIALRAAGRRSQPTTVGRPIQIFSVHYMNVTQTTPRGLGLEAGQPGRARATRSGWKPVQLVPENARAGPRRLPARGGARAATRRSGSRSTPGATSRRASTKARSP